MRALTTAEQNSRMVAEFSKEEVYEELRDINDTKTPGPDGFSALFYKKSWLVIGEEMTLNSSGLFSKKQNV